MIIQRETGQCYACCAVATTKEHVPPKSFYPQGRREHLITLPSCKKHNNENSADVEYVRNVLSAHFETNIRIADSVYKASWRSYDRGPAILKKVFRDITPVFYNGQETATFTVEMQRVDRVMSAIATGMYRKVFSRLFCGSWVILCPSSVTTYEIATGKPDVFQVMRDALAKLRTEPIATPHPDIFACGMLADSLHELVFEFRFFSGPKFYAVSIPPWKNLPKNRESRTQ